MRDCGVGDVAAVLYGYNRIPRPPAVDDAPPQEVGRRAGLDGSAIAALLANGWRDSGVTDGWRTFTHSAAAAFDSEREMTKLYVSPRPDDMSVAVRALLSAFATEDVTPLAFKVASTADGFYRPDKVVVYLTGRDDLVDVVERLCPRLEGVGAQGVPFTAALAADGLMSWGVDPPRRVAEAGGVRHSWRSWVTYRLARHLVSSDGDDPVAASLELVRREGVDPLTWQPSARIWDRAVRGGGR